MPRPRKQILPFRIPFFRIFYSTTYTTLFLITLVFLAFTPGTLIYSSFSSAALQYVFIVGGVYILTALFAIFIYTSRLYTNRTVLAGVGKAYIPVEDGEVGKSVRRLIVGQLERSAVVSWEAKPRDIGDEKRDIGEEEYASADGTEKSEGNRTLGTIILIDPKHPPWGNIQHRGWTAPARSNAELQGNLQFEIVIAEMPNLIEARAVSLAPLDPAYSHDNDGQTFSDPTIVELLRRQEKMGMREYLTQLSYLRLVDMQSCGQDFLSRYERARFSGLPASYIEFKALMTAFARLMESMTTLHPAISEEIRIAAASTRPAVPELDQLEPNIDAGSILHHRTPSPPSSSSTNITPVTAHTRLSRSATPYMAQHGASAESVGSVVIASAQDPLRSSVADTRARSPEPDGASLQISEQSFGSDIGSVVRHDVDR